MVETNEILGNFPILDWDMHLGIMKSEFILGISVKIFQVFSHKSIRLNLARRQILLFAYKKKDLVRIELMFFIGSYNYCQSEYEDVLVNFLSDFTTRHF